MLPWLDCKVILFLERRRSGELLPWLHCKVILFFTRELIISRARAARGHAHAVTGT